EKVGLVVSRVGELTLPLTGCSTWESGLCTSPGLYLMLLAGAQRKTVASPADEPRDMTQQFGPKSALGSYISPLQDPFSPTPSTTQLLCSEGNNMEEGIKRLTVILAGAKETLKAVSISVSMVNKTGPLFYSIRLCLALYHVHAASVTMVLWYKLQTGFDRRLR
ncbi:hypothetical protein STEG23_017928, partial [Scotinomys teguina]